MAKSYLVKLQRNSATEIGTKRCESGSYIYSRQRGNLVQMMHDHLHTAFLSRSLLLKPFEGLLRELPGVPPRKSQGPTPSLATPRGCQVLLGDSTMDSKGSRDGLGRDSR